MPGDIRTGIRLTADVRGLVSEVRAARQSLDRLSQTVDRSDGGSPRLHGDWPSTEQWRDELCTGA